MTFTAGQKIRATELNDLTSAFYVASNVTVNNSTTFVNATGLAIPVRASSRYAIEGYLMFATNNTADIKFGWTYPTATTGSWSLWGVPTTGSSRIDVIDTGVVAEFVGLSASGDNAIPPSCKPVFTAATSTTAGTIQLQFAQNTANASNTILLAGSFLRATKML